MNSEHIVLIYINWFASSLFARCLSDDKQITTFFRRLKWQYHMCWLHLINSHIIVIDSLYFKYRRYNSWFILCHFLYINLHTILFCNLFWQKYHFINMKVISNVDSVSYFYCSFALLITALDVWLSKKKNWDCVKCCKVKTWLWERIKT